MYTPVFKKKFNKDVKRVIKRGKAMPKLKSLMQKLIKGEVIDPRYLDHALKGDYSDCRECHIEPDWLLIYLIKDEIITFIRTGSHADLF